MGMAAAASWMLIPFFCKQGLGSLAKNKKGQVVIFYGTKDGIFFPLLSNESGTVDSVDQSCCYRFSNLLYCTDLATSCLITRYSAQFVSAPGKKPKLDLQVGNGLNPLFMHMSYLTCTIKN
jgi:hypothetical protein